MRRGYRVVMVTEYAYPVLGGISEHVHYLSRELARLGHDVTVLTSRADPEDRERAAAIDAHNQDVNGYRTVRIGVSRRFDINGSTARFTYSHTLWWQLRRALRGAEVVHVQGLVGPVLPLASILASDARGMLGTFHTYVEGGRHWAYRFFMIPLRMGFRRLYRQIAVSQVCVDSLEPYLHGRWEVVPNGIDTEVYHPLLDESQRDPGPPRVLFVGRFDERNGLHTLLEAAGILTRRGYDFELQVVGDGPTRPQYEAQAREHGVWDRVRWLGLLNEERPELYRQATLLAAPCTLASFGVVLLEAMASGTPVVCADNVGFRQVIRDDAPGLFVGEPDRPAPAYCPQLP